MRYLWIVLSLSVLLIGSSLWAANDQPKKPTAAPTMAETQTVQKQGRYLTTITMENGKKIELVLEGGMMPYTAANFINLAKSGFYNGLVFHRVEEGFVIQGGDPLGADAEKAGTGGPGYMINLEISPFLRHYEGAISMARSQSPDSAGSQFFITTGDANFLDGKYAVFGWVKSGMDVVKAVKVGDKMKTVTVVPYAGTEACPILQK